MKYFEIEICFLESKEEITHLKKQEKKKTKPQWIKYSKNNKSGTMKIRPFNDEKY